MKLEKIQKFIPLHRIMSTLPRFTTFPVLRISKQPCQVSLAEVAHSPSSLTLVTTTFLRDITTYTHTLSVGTDCCALQC